MNIGKINQLVDDLNKIEGVGEAYTWAVCYSAEEAAQVIGEYLGIEALKEIET